MAERVCAYVGPVESGGPYSHCQRPAHAYSLWCVDCTTLIGSMPQDMHAGVLHRAALRLDPSGDRAQALVSAVLESHRDDVPPRLRDLALAATVTPGAGAPIASCSCPCCGAHLRVDRAERGQVAVHGTMLHVIARPLDQWNYEDGAVLWWRCPVVEPPYVGTPTDDDWPGYHTHWTRLAEPHDFALEKAREAANG